MAVASAGHVQVCTSRQTDTHASTSPLRTSEAVKVYCPVFKMLVAFVSDTAVFTEIMKFSIE